MFNHFLKFAYDVLGTAMAFFKQCEFDKMSR